MAVEAQTPRELELERKQKEAEITNKGRSGLGTRVRVGQTRGKNPVVITWEAFDESIPDSLPKTIQQFMDVTGVKEEDKLVSLLVAGQNDANYTAASDPLREYVNPVWPDEVQTQFRIIVRQMAKAMEQTLEETAPPYVAAFNKKYGQPSA